MTSDADNPSASARLGVNRSARRARKGVGQRSVAGFSRLVERAGTGAKFGFKAHPQMLRHACGFALANKSHATRALPRAP